MWKEFCANQVSSPKTISICHTCHKIQHDMINVMRMSRIKVYYMLTMKIMCVKKIVLFRSRNCASTRTYMLC